MRRPSMNPTLVAAALAMSRRRLLARTAASVAGLAVGTTTRFAPLGSLTTLPALAEGTPDNGIARSTAAAQEPDWDVPGGHFYTQSAPPDAAADSGFVVSDDDGLKFWHAYNSLGGPAKLGFPISSRYESGGITYQAMEAGLLRWDVDASQADIFPVFVALSDFDLDDWLESRGIPRPAQALLDDPDLAGDVRLSWLTHPTLRDAYYGSNDGTAEMRFGLPMSEPERFGPYLAQRFDKAVLQLWLDDLPNQPAAGTVSMVQVGELLKDADLIPAESLAPIPAPAPRPVKKLVDDAGPAPDPTLVAGKYILVSLSKQTWYAYEDGKVVYSGPVTTGQPALPTPAGRFSVMSRHSPYTMISPWGPGSPFYYAPSNMTYALQITGNGVFLHDAPWRPYYGPGTNFLHLDPDGVYRTGSHGCINLPFQAAAFLWGFAPIGTPVDVVP